MPPNEKKNAPKNLSLIQKEQLSMAKTELIQKIQSMTNKLSSEQRNRETFSTQLEHTLHLLESHRKYYINRRNELQTIENELENRNLNHNITIDKIKNTIKHQILLHQSELVNIEVNRALLFDDTDLKLERSKNYSCGGGIQDIVSHKQRSTEIKTSNSRFLKLLFAQSLTKNKLKYDDIKLNLQMLSTDSDNYIKSLLEDRELKLKEQTRNMETIGQLKLNEEENNFEKIIHDIRTFYNGKMKEQLDMMDILKLALSDKRKRYFFMERRVHKMKKNNKCIVEPFHAAKEALENLMKKSSEFKRERMYLVQNKADLLSDDNLLKDLIWHYEVLYQRFQLLSQETSCSKIKSQMLHLKQVLELNQQSQTYQPCKINIQTLHDVGLALLTSISTIIIEHNKNDLKSKTNDKAVNAYKTQVSLTSLKNMELHINKLIQY